MPKTGGQVPTMIIILTTRNPLQEHHHFVQVSHRWTITNGVPADWPRKRASHGVGYPTCKSSSINFASGMKCAICTKGPLPTYTVAGTDVLLVQLIRRTPSNSVPRSSTKNVLGPTCTDNTHNSCVRRESLPFLRAYATPSTRLTIARPAPMNRWRHRIRTTNKHSTHSQALYVRIHVCTKSFLANEACLYTTSSNPPYNEEYVPLPFTKSRQQKCHVVYKPLQYVYIYIRRHGVWGSLVSSCHKTEWTHMPKAG